MQFFAEIHVKVHPNITVKEGHDIAGSVTDRLLEKFPQMASVLVHVEPCFDGPSPAVGLRPPRGEHLERR